MMNKVINWSFFLTNIQSNWSKLKLVFFEENQGQTLSWWHEDDNWSCWAKFEMNMIIALTLNKQTVEEWNGRNEKKKWFVIYKWKWNKFVQRVAGSKQKKIIIYGRKISDFLNMILKSTIESRSHGNFIIKHLIY